MTFAGALRQWATLTVDPQLSDDEPLRDRPRGGQAEDQLPDELRPAVIEPSRDLREMLAGQPPTRLCGNGG